MPRSTWLALSLILGGSTASAVPITLDLDSDDDDAYLVFDAPAGWDSMGTGQAAVRTPTGPIVVAAMFSPGACTSFHKTVETLHQTQTSRPGWAPTSWFAKSGTKRDGDQVSHSLCRDYHAGHIFFAVTFKSTADTASLARLRSMLVAMEGAAAADSTPAFQPTTTTLTLTDVNMNLTVPKGYGLEGEWIALPGNLDKEAVRIGTYPTTISCQQGMSAQPDETMASVPSGTPNTFHDRAATKTTATNTQYALCSDVTGGVMIVDVTTSKSGPLPADLATIVASAGRVAHEAGRSAPKKLKVVFQDLDGATLDLPADAGGWRVFPLPIFFGLEQMWPRTSAMVTGIVEKEACDFAGSDPMMPSPWRSTWSKGALHGCVMHPDGRARRIVLSTIHPLRPEDRPRVASVIHALATVFYPSTAAPNIGASSTSTPAPSTTAPEPEVAAAEPGSSSAEPAPAYVPPSDRGDSDSRPLRTYLYGVSLAGHLFAVDGVDDSYGVSLGYTRALAARLRLALEAGYNQNSGLLVDGRLELGSYFGDDENSVGLWGMLGVDGVGVGEDEMSTAPRIDADLYYGLRTQIVMSSIDLGLGYVWRNADTVDHAWRFDLGYRLESGHHLGFRYTGYGDAGHFLSLAFRY